MTTNKEKGNQLEDAISAIESYIFSVQPALKESTILFEKNKIVTLKGAKNEIDLYAQIDMGKGYSALFIFECKNWNKKVSKNDIIIFSEKVRELNAQKGFFIAKEFTSDAIKRSKNDGRIELIKVDKALTLDQFPIEYYSPNVKSLRLEIEGDIERRPYKEDEIFEHKGFQVTLFSIIDKLLQELQLDIYNTNPVLMLTEHTFDRDKIFEFKEGELTFQQNKIVRIKMAAFFEIKRITPFVKSQFNIENRGRYCTIEFKDDNNNITFTTSFSQLQ